MQIRKYSILRKKAWSAYIFLALMFYFAGCSTTKEISNQSVDPISNYEIGHNRTMLTDLELKVKESLKSEGLREKLETRFINILGSDATFDSKQFASRQLRIIGSERSIPVLSKLLVNESTTNLATYALEVIPGNAVDETLIEAIPNASKKIQLGIISTLGERKSSIAIDELEGLLRNSDYNISSAAASALGKIATKECADILGQNIGNSIEPVKSSVIDSYLLCADNLLNNNDKIESGKIYKTVFKSDAQLHFRKAALVGIINSSKNPEDEISKRLASESDEMKIVVISKMRDVLKGKYNSEFSQKLENLNPANQVQLLAVIQDIGDKSSKKYVLQTLNSDLTSVRLAALDAISEIGDETDVLNLAKLATRDNKPEADKAMFALSRLKGKLVDEKILNSIPMAENNIKSQLINAVGTRDIKTGISTIMNYTDSEDRKVKSEAFKALGELAADENLPQLIDLLFSQKSSSDKMRAERTISNVVKKSQAKEKAAQLLLKFLAESTDPLNDASLMRILGFTSSNSAEKVLDENLANENKSVQIAAIQGLSVWSTPDPLQRLKKLAENTTDQKVRSAALKGFTNFIHMDNSLSNDQKLDLYKKSLNLSNTSNERNIALNGIGHIEMIESLDILRDYINQPDVKETVDEGINRVSRRIYQKDPEKVKNYMLDFLDLIKDEAFQKRNKDLVKAIDEFIQNGDAK